MIKSMTGFGRYESEENGRKISVEIKSVNHKYLDVNIRMPRKFNVFEAGLRRILKEYALRGKIDIFVNYESENAESENVRFNRTLAGEYLGYLSEMQELYGLRNEVNTVALARFPDVFTMEDGAIDEDAVRTLLEAVFRKACENFVASRREEGIYLRKDLCEKLEDMESCVAFIEERYPQLLEDYKTRLRAKLSEVLEDTQIDENRVAAELVIYADKICVDEETVRLKSHIRGMKEELEHGDGQGRKLDFITQEMNRESNTILSKSNDLEITDKGIELKTEIEKIREQVQNIE